MDTLKTIGKGLVAFSLLAVFVFSMVYFAIFKGSVVALILGLLILAVLYSTLPYSSSRYT